jgi:competence protein ComEC
MVAVMLVAVLADRRALTLRSVALAAILLLLLRPESLLAPGFQMSFAATVVLIAGFAALDRGIVRERVPRWVMPVFTLVLSSVLAGLATAPLAAAHQSAALPDLEHRHRTDHHPVVAALAAAALMV